MVGMDAPVRGSTGARYHGRGGQRNPIGAAVAVDFSIRAPFRV
jgi:hypothetical protein